MHGAEFWNVENEEEFVDEKTMQNDCGETVCMSNHVKEPEEIKQSLLKTRLLTTPITYDYSMLSSKFVDASTELCRQNSSNLEYQLVKYNTRKGLRHSSYHAYLRPAFSRPNLKIVLATRVDRILFSKKNAIGVSAAANNLQAAFHKIYATKQVILSAGAFHTPQILKLSGIGPSKELKRFEINVVHHSPMVGRNLYDHMSMPIYVSVNETMSVTRSKVLNLLEVMNYFLHGRGIFSNFGVIGYLTDTEQDHATGIFGVGSIDERLLRKIVNYDKDVRIIFFKFNLGDMFKRVFLHF